MKKNRSFLLIVAGTLLLFAGYFVGEMGGLFGIILTVIGICVLGATFIYISITDMIKSEAERKNKITWLTIVLGIVCLFIGGKNLVSVCMDVGEGTKQMRISECVVMKTSSRRRIFSHFDLAGIGEDGEYISLSIDKKTYEKYDDELSFDVDVVYWEHTGVIKEILE